jgi:hypothetical protein
VKNLPLLALALGLAACGSLDEKLAPTATEIADAGPDAAPPPATSVRRTVSTRNPFGGRAGNLLVDGDFELSTVPQAGAQLGWRAFSADGSGTVNLATETGGLCRSGLRCAVLPKGAVVLVQGTSARGKGNVASAWAKPPADATCSKVRVILVDCESFDVHAQLTSEDKGADGWCHYGATLAEQQSPTCMYVESSLAKDTTAILDAFFLGPDDGTVQPLAAEHWAPEPELVATLQRIRAHEIATRPFGRAPRRPPPMP